MTRATVRAIGFISKKPKGFVKACMKTKRYFFCTEPDEMRYKVLADRARLFKKTEKGVRAMSGVLEEKREDVAEKKDDR